MPAPEGYDKLSVIGYSHKGEYNPVTTYNKYNNVYYNGNTYVALKDGLLGVEPSDDRENWMIMARGFAAEDAAEIQATDTSNLVGGGEGKKTVLQTLLDKIAEIAVKAVMTDTFQTQLKKYLANNGTTNTEGFALDARYGKTLQDSIDTLNRKTNIAFFNTIDSLSLETGCSVIDVINALPNNSIFIRGNLYNDNAISGNMPPDYMNGGTLFISKANNRLIIKYQRQNANSVLEPPTEYIGTTENANPTTLKWFSATLTEAS